MADKNKAIIEYLLTCQDIESSPLYFNFANAKDSIKQFLTLTTDVTLNSSYVDGSVLKRYSLTVMSYLSISDNPIAKVAGYDNENITDIAEVQALMDWVNAQEQVGNYPNFGTECIVDAIRTTSNNPRLEQIDATVNPPLAKYSFTVQVDYIDTSTKIWS